MNDANDKNKINMLKDLVEIQDYYIRLLSEVVRGFTDAGSYKLQRVANKVTILTQKIEDSKRQEIQSLRERNIK